MSSLARPDPAFAAESAAVDRLEAMAAIRSPAWAARA